MTLLTMSILSGLIPLLAQHNSKTLSATTTPTQTPSGQVQEALSQSEPTPSSETSASNSAANARQGQAESNASNASLKSQKTQKNEEVLRQVITNNRLAADAGIARPLSFRWTWNYAGGTINNPFGEIRPNYRKLPGNPFTLTSIGGTLGLAYRFTPTVQGRLLTSFVAITPFNRSLNEWINNRFSPANGQAARVYTFNSVVGEINRVSRVGKTMISQSLSASVPMQEHAIRNIGLFASTGGGVNVIWDLAPSKWQPMVAFGVAYPIYRDAGIFDRQNRRREELSWGIYPAVEYLFNSTYTFRTVFGFFNYTKYRDQAWGQWYREGHYISSGIGFSPKRGIWIYPNIQFNPEDIRADLTNVGIQATINL